MQKLMICGLVLASGFVSGVAIHRNASGVRYVALPAARAAAQEAAGGAKAAEPTPDELAQKAYAALDKNCSMCHGAGKRMNKVAAVDPASYERLLKEQALVVPGKPGDSQLYTVMLDPDPERLMPPPRVQKRPKPEEIEAIRLWIEKGAPAPKAPQEAKDAPAPAPANP